MNFLNRKRGEFFLNENSLNTINPLKLAFIGDSVFDLLIRKHIVCNCNESIGELNKRKIKIVCCKGQSEFIKKILEALTPDEMNIYKWGRNAHVKHKPKNASVIDYHRATGLECLLGYLYLSGNIDRIEQLLKEVNYF